MKLNIKETDSFLRGLLWASCIIIGTLMLFRLLFVFLYVPGNILTAHSSDLYKVLYNALRFDFQIAAYAALLPTVIMLILLFVSTPKYQKWCRNFCSWYYTIVATLLALLSAIDLGYFANFNSHISFTFFDFFDEEPLSLIQTIWDDYPVIWILIGLCFWGTVTRIASKWAFLRPSQTKSCSTKKTTIAIMLYIAAIVVCMRGSIGRFPLQVEDLVVSVSERINDIIPNAPYMLKKALKEKSMVFDIKPTATLLKEYSFKNLQEAMDTFFI